MNKVLETTKFVVDNAQYVKINKEKITEFCNNFEESHINHWIKQGPYDLTKLNDKDKLHFLLVFNSISFSYWGEPKWTVDYHGEKFDGSWGMIAALGKAIENKAPILNMKWLSTITEKEFADIMKGNVKIPHLKERILILKEVGSIITQKYEGDFSNVLKKANGDAMELLKLIISTFHSFNDTSSYKNKTINFYKRAQLLISDIYQLFNGRDYGKLKNINRLTACADYKIPWILRKFGILSYSESLAKTVDNKIELQHGSEEEIEIRASTIWANELIKQKLKKKIPSIDSIHINYHLWLLSQAKSADDKPYHLTRTTTY